MIRNTRLPVFSCHSEMNFVRIYNYYCSSNNVHMVLSLFSITCETALRSNSFPDVIFERHFWGVNLRKMAAVRFFISSDCGDLSESGFIRDEGSATGG